MMYNMDNNVRGCPCGKKEEAIPMARKWLSGALAFAMIFGCSAPVALAEETPVEVVEQESLEGVEQYSSYLPSLDATSVKLAPNSETTVNILGVDDSLDEVELVVSGSGVTAKTGSDKTKIVIKTTNDFAADATISVTLKPKAGDWYAVKEFTIAVKKVGIKDQLLINDKIVSTNESITGKSVMVDEDLEFVFKAGSEDDYTNPASLTYRLTTGAEEYISVSEEAVIENGEKVGTKLVVTGKKETEKPVKIEVTSKAVSTTYKNELEISVVKNTNPTTPNVEYITLKTDKTTLEKGATANIVAQAYVANEYGDIIADDYADMVWYLDGEELKFDASGTATYKIDGLNAYTVTVTKTKKQNGNYLDGIVTFVTDVAGTYNLTVKDTKNTTSKSVEITVTDKTATAGTFAIEDLDSVTMLPAEAYNLNSVVIKDQNGKTPADFGYTVEYSLAAIENTTSEYQKIPQNQLEVVANIKNGTLSLVSADHYVMDGLFTAAKTRKLAFYVNITIKDADDVQKGAVTLPVYVVKESSDKISTVEVTANGETVSLTLDQQSKEYVANYVATIGKAVDFDAILKDENGKTTGIDQSMSWTIENRTTNTSEVYATVDNITGVLSPVKVVNGYVYLVGVAKADTTVKVKIQLFITDDPNATPVPSPTATPEPSPTTEPSPTAAPVVRTGVVVNVSSNLNIRAAANTSSTVVTKVKNGTDLIILGEEGNFYKVQLADGKIGYASKDYVRETTDTPVQPTGDYAIVTTKGGRLNMRQTAGGAVITSIANGTRVDVIREGSEWTLIEYNGRQGYVSTGFLTIYHGAVG